MKGVELLLLFVTRIKCITFRLSLSKQVHVLVFTRLRLLIEWTAIKSSRLNIILYMNFFFFMSLSAVQIYDFHIFLTALFFISETAQVNSGSLCVTASN